MYDYKRAYCLLRYASDDGTAVEFIWNSRDGTVPIQVVAKDGVTALVRIPSDEDTRPRIAHCPMPGDRVFIDLPEVEIDRLIDEAAEDWEARALEKGESFIAADETYGREKMREALTRSPYLFTVPEDGWCRVTGGAHSWKYVRVPAATYGGRVTFIDQKECTRCGDRR